MRFYLIIISCLLASSFLFSQNILFKGKVTDINSLSPVHGAYISIDGNFFFTNHDGVFRVVVKNPGTYQYKIGHLGYKSESGSITFESAGVVEQNYFLTPTLIEMDEVYVTSNRKERLLKSSPVSELLISSEQIEVKPFNTLADAVKSEAGVSLMRDGIWGTEMTIRGMSRQNVVALIDGARIETSTEQAARLSLIDMNSIERIEIVKGAASSSYGTGATGGIINIVSKTPRFNDEFYIDGNFSGGMSSANNSNTVSGGINAVSEIWALNLNGSYRKAADMETPRGDIKNSRYEDYGLSGTLSLIPFEGHQFDLKFQKMEAQDVGIPGGAPLFTNVSDVRYPIEKREMLSLNYRVVDLTSFLKRLNFSASKQYILRDVEVIPYAVQTVPKVRRVSVLKLTPGADHYFNSLRLDGDFIIFQGNILNAGIDFWSREYIGKRERFQKIETLDTLNNVTGVTEKIIGEKPLPDSRFHSLGFFVQDDYEVIKNKLSLSFGSRLDLIYVKGEETYNPDYEITNGVRNDNPPTAKLNWPSAEYNDESFSANLGGIYSIDENLSVTLNLGYAFRSPSLEERFQFIDLGNLVRLGNPYLAPEKGRFADFGIRYYTNELKIISSFFYNSIIDYVIEEPGTYEGRAARIKTNVGSARLYGFDLSGNYNVYDRIIVNATLSLVNGEDTKTNQYLPMIPPLNGSIGVSFRNDVCFNPAFSVEFYGWQKKVAHGEEMTSGYAVYNISVSSPAFKFNRSEVRMFAGIDNIFNKAYRNHLSTARGSVTIEPGRNIFFKANVAF
ncbi:MAG: TonB-dependent receptor [Ignavibacteriaceae bacterium]|nr:TonB-dependent receptor [Ignavibacteriaceae bacterium]